MKIRSPWCVWFFVLAAWIADVGLLVGQTKETPESVEPPLQITSDGANRYEGGIYYAEDNVTVTYGGDVLMADQVHFNPTTKEATAKGNVRLYMMDQIYRGDLLTYNFRTKKILSEKFRFLDGKMMVEGQTINTPEIGHYEIDSGHYSTDNRETPGWKVKASSVSLYPDDKTIVENSVAYFGDVPFFWFPYLVQYQRDTHSSVDISPGSVSRLGTYARGAYRFSMGESLRGTINLDYFSRRGWAGGAQVAYKTPDKDLKPGQMPTEVSLRGWYINDRGYQIYEGTEERPANALPPRGRYWFPYSHNTTLMQGGNRTDPDRAPAFDTPSLSSRSRVNVLSDAYVTQDFFADDYIRDQQPNTFLDAMYQDPNFTVTANARTQINSLFQTQQQKPSAKIEFKRQFIPGTYDKEEFLRDPDSHPGLAYEGESSVSYLGTQWNQVANQTDYTAIRYDTYHQLLYPRQYFDWLNFTPKAGIRGTVYTRNNLAPGNVVQNTQTNTPGANIGNNAVLSDTSLFRYVVNLGADISTKVHATWSDAKEKAWGIDGLRHVMEPFVNFSYVPRPNVRPTEFAGFDNRVNSTQSTPLNSSLYNSIDSIDQLLVARPGIMNRVLTKRDGEPYELANWKIYGDYQPIRPDLPGLNTAKVQVPETISSDFPEIYNELNVMPVPWWTGTLGAATAVSGNGYNAINLGTRWQAIPALQLGLGYSFLENFAYVDALNNQILTDTQTQILNGSADYRLNESWFFNAGVTYSMNPDLLQQVSFGVYRDLGAWILGASVANRQNQGSPSEFVALATLTLKAFPEIPLGFNQAPTSSGISSAGQQQGY
ncbi:LPS-assembly protein LptD [bacterium]|nr:LPS-assembly protein LptD [bacterium]